MTQARSSERRVHRRLALSLPIRAWGTDQDGRPFFADGSTLDVSSGGVRFRIATPPDPRRPLMVYIAPSPGSPAEAYRLRAALTVLRVEGPGGGEEDWTVAGRFRPEDAEWLQAGPDGGECE
jgi:hypothetical protein